MAISNPVTVGNTGMLTASSTTCALTTTANVPAGSKLWVLITFFNSVGGAGPQTVTVADGTNTYTVDVQGGNQVNTTTCHAIASADIPVQLNSGATITATFSAAAVSRSVAAMYSSGVQIGAGAAYGAVSQNQNSTAAWSSTTTTVNNGDILIGGSHWEDSVTVTNTPSGGNTEVDDYTVSGSGGTTCYQIGTGAAIAAQGTWSTSSGSPGLRSSAVAYKQAVTSFSRQPPHLPFIQQNHHSPI